MKPVALLQHDAAQRPGVLREFLSQQGIPCVTFSPDDGGFVPRTAGDYSGLVLLGSPHSVNERLSWIALERDLIRSAMALDVPVLGTCFGAQQMARALGAPVSRNVWANIGWSTLRVTRHARAFFQASEIPSFNWHYETFGIPKGAQRLLFGTHCLNKGFSIGKHLAFQCHFEVTEEIVRDWCRDAAHELDVACGPAVQSRQEILSRLHAELPALHDVARRVYRHWVAGLVRPVMVASRGRW